MNSTFRLTPSAFDRPDALAFAVFFMINSDENDRRAMRFHSN